MSTQITLYAIITEGTSKYKQNIDSIQTMLIIHLLGYNLIGCDTIVNSPSFIIVLRSRVEPTVEIIKYVLSVLS